ncbi:hypothetical protein ACFL5K_00990, partial [Gemmatimonadota bacterium]
IIPEFAYKTLYDSKYHSFYRLSTDEQDTPKIKHKGYYDRLLCKECEQRVGLYESYASSVFRGKADMEKKVTEKLIVFRNLNYALFKLFFLSILWRASISKLKEFPIHLGSHEERIRKMLLDQNPGDQFEYGLIASFNPQMQSFLQQMMTIPESIRIKNHLCYRFLLSGLFWLIIVSSHSYRFPYKDTFLSPDGTLLILVDVKWSSKFMIELSKKLNIPEIT